MSYRNRAIHSLTIDDFCGASFIRADVHKYEIVSKREARIKFCQGNKTLQVTLSEPNCVFPVANSSELHASTFG